MTARTSRSSRLFLLILYMLFMLALLLMPSGGETEWLGPLAWLKPFLPNVVHVLLFMGLAFLLLLVIQDFRPLAHKRTLAALGFAGLFGTITECAQAFVPGRTPSVADIGFDIFGAFLGVAAFFVLECTRQNQRQMKKTFTASSEHGPKH